MNNNSSSPLCSIAPVRTGCHVSGWEIVVQWSCSGSGWNGNLAHENHGEAWLGSPAAWHRRRYYTSGSGRVVAPGQVPDGHTPAMICAHTTESVSYAHINTVVMRLSNIRSMSCAATYLQVIGTTCVVHPAPVSAQY